MEKLTVLGGVRLSGEVAVGGFKNAALPILYATLLTGGVSLIDNLPDIRDVAVTLRILSAMGCRVTRCDPHTVEIDTADAVPCRAPDGLVGSLRASSYLLGAELGRFGISRLPLPGGCRIGARPLDLHISALTSLGAEIREEGGALLAVSEGLHGIEIGLRTPSVGATVNVLLAAVTADGITTLRGAAREPHIADLCTYLSAAGGDIEGIGTDTLTVRGVPALHGAAHRLMPDMIEAGTFLTAVGAAGGEIAIHGACRAHLDSVIAPLLSMGMDIRTEGDILVASRCGLLSPFELTAAPYPALPTDMHPQMAALATQAAGVSYIRDTVFPDRLAYVRELRRMGAKICALDGGVRVTPSRLRGGRVHAVDLRAGAALTVAALAARGRTVIKEAEVLGRGYEQFAEKLTALGACVTS